MDSLTIAPITTMPFLAHPCAQCGNPCWLHALCPACRPADLCDYCDAVAVVGDPDHACAACRAQIERENESYSECRHCGEPTRESERQDGHLCGRCVGREPSEREWEDVAADEAGVPRWGPI